jgi:hypothetical protein
MLEPRQVSSLVSEKGYFVPFEAQSLADVPVAQGLAASHEVECLSER